MPFAPTDLSGLELWLDASDASTLWTDTGATTHATATSDPVARWDDKSGNGRNATQSTSGNRPLLNLAAQNGRNVLYFDGTDDYLSVPLDPSAVFPEAFTVLVVAKLDDTSARSWSWIYGETSGGGASGFFYGKSGFTSGTHFAASDWHGGIDSGSPDISAAYHLFGQQESDTVRRALQDGVAATDTTNTNSSLTATTFNIGGRTTTEPWKGPIVELAVYSRVLSAAERRNAESYLQTKWATPALPTAAVQPRPPAQPYVRRRRAANW